MEALSCFRFPFIMIHTSSFTFWTHGFSRNGPTNLASSVRNADISGSARQKFLIFCTKLEQHKCRKVTFSDFRKKLLTPLWAGSKGQIWPKIGLFQRLLPNCAPEFFDFLHKLDNNKAFQTMYILSSGKLLPRPSRGQKVKFWTQN